MRASCAVWTDIDPRLHIHFIQESCMFTISTRWMSSWDIGRGITARMRWLSVFLAFIMVGSAAFAQTPQYYIGSGSTGSNSFPLNTTSSKKTQLNYLAGEFAGAFIV